MQVENTQVCVVAEDKAAQVIKRTALIVSCMSSFLTPFMASSINIALPSIGLELSVDAVSLGLVATAYLLAAAMFLVPFGRISDIVGRKRIFIYGMIVDATFALFCALSGSSIALVAFRFLQGLGAAMIFGTGIAILTSVYPPHERGKVLGINVAAVYTGLSVGPFLGGLITDTLGWRSIFFLNVLLGSITIGVVLWKLKGEWAGAKGEKFDPVGSMVYSIMLVAVMAGLYILPDPRGLILILVGILATVAFVQWELAAPSPVLDVHLFRGNRVFAFSNLAALLNYSATFAVGFLLSLYLQYVKLFTAETAGLILISQPVVMAVFSPFTGRLSDRIEPRIISSAGMAITVIGLVLLAFLGSDTSLTFIIAALVLLGLGFALFSSPNTNAVMGSVERRFYGVASATIGTMRLIGQMLSLGISMLVFSLFIGRVQIAPENFSDFLRSSDVIFLIFAVLCFGGIFASMARGATRQA